MAIGAMTKVWEAFEAFPAGGSELLVLLKLADYGDERGENIFPSMETIAKYARITERQAQRVMARLIADGLVEVVGNSEGGRGRSRRYRVRLDRLTPHEKGGADDTLSEIKDDTSATHYREKDDIQRHERTTSRAIKGDTDVTRTVIEPLKEPSGKDIQARTRKRRATPIPDGFTISSEVRSWANDKGFSRLEERLEHFVDAAIAKGYKYANWDAAFKNAIRQDWACFNNTTRQKSHAEQHHDALIDYAADTATGPRYDRRSSAKRVSDTLDDIAREDIERNGFVEILGNQY